MFIIFSLKSENRFIKNGIVKKQVGCVVALFIKVLLLKLLLGTSKIFFRFPKEV